MWTGGCLVSSRHNRPLKEHGRRHPALLFTTSFLVSTRHKAFSKQAIAIAISTLHQAPARVGKSVGKAIGLEVGLCWDQLVPRMA
jgi:hypothetical protein